MQTSIRRSRSLNFHFIPRESYLSRWSRENTPIDSDERYIRNVRRSYTPVRAIAAAKTNVIRSTSASEAYEIGRSNTLKSVMASLPYHTNFNYYLESQPLRKYDVFQIRTWAYPIYKYLHSRNNYKSEFPYSYSRIYGNTSLYTPPMMAAEAQALTSRRGYSGYTPIAGEHSYDLTSRPKSLSNYKLRRSYAASSPLYWSYYGNCALRHYSSYRPKIYSSRIRTYPSYF